MKNLIFFALSFLFIATSCSKDDDLGKSVGLPANTISAKIDGHDFTTTAQSQINNVFFQLFTIAGAVDVGNGEYETLLIVFNFPIGETLPERSYQYSGMDCTLSEEICGLLAYGIRNPDDELTHSSVAENGTGNSKITFTDLDYKPGGHATGIFSGVLVSEAGDEINITDGKFNVTIAK